ncbi:ABC transporter substrate-binding protein [Isoptericola sp. NPDC056578]|uniref:ABC transporter substrate-binding protein n=1 Tax=unclassified Isoptericola TaxID=2623355 RepID=UPI0036A85353
MRLARKAAGATAALAAAALTLTGCGGGPGTAEPGSAEKLRTDEDITLSMAWWGDNGRADLYEKAIDVFEERHPNVTVQTQFQSWDDYWGARATEAAGGALPDVVQMDLQYVRQYASTGQLLDLDGQAGINLDLDGVDPSLLASGEIDGRQFGIPISTNTLALFYNADLLDELGIDPPAEGYTWDDLDAWIAEASRAGAGDDPVRYGLSDYTGQLWFLLQWLIQQGVEPFTDDGRLNFDEAQMTRWLDRGQPLRDAGALFPIKKAKQIEPLDGFMAGEQVAAMTWDNFLGSYEAETGAEVRMLPMPSGANGPQQFWKPGMMLSASSSTTEPDAAAALIDFLVNDPEVGKIFGTSKGVPATQAQIDAIEVEPGSVDERVVRFEKDVADVVTEPAPVPVQGIGELNAELVRLSDELQYGSLTVDELVAQWFSFAESTVGQS